MPERGSAGY